MGEEKLIKKAMADRVRWFREKWLQKPERPAFIKEHVVELDWTMGELSDSTLQKWEGISPSWKYLMWLHNHYHLKWEWLIEGKEPMQE